MSVCYLRNLLEDLLDFICKIAQIHVRNKSSKKKKVLKVQ